MDSDAGYREVLFGLLVSSVNQIIHTSCNTFAYLIAVVLNVTHYCAPEFLS
jgi:hypothetical protein